jgi:hypothetical protein
MIYYLRIFMKLLKCCLMLLLICKVVAKPTESRTWTAVNGKAVEGVILSIENGSARLKRSDGKVISVKLSLFVELDKTLILEHFGIIPRKPGDPVRSKAKPAENLALAIGQQHMSVQATPDSHYLLYIPKSLKAGQLAPVLFNTHSSGGKRSGITKLVEGAELCGWILAASQESKNGNSFNHNHDVSQKAVEHIFKTLPAEAGRLYFEGNSGGAATALGNAAKMKCLGVMPNVGYMPNHVRPPRVLYYVIGGGSDFNRYASAGIAKKFGDNAVHRLNPGAHSAAPIWQRIDGMIWFQIKYLANNRRDHADEALDFEARMIEWIKLKTATESHRAYYAARLLVDEYKIDGRNGSIVEKLLQELNSNDKNRLYYEGLAVLDEISKKGLADITGGTKNKHTTPSNVIRMINKEMPRFIGVPVIEETMKAILKPTS